jgi:hypothetical protein
VAVPEHFREIKDACNYMAQTLLVLHRETCTYQHNYWTWSIKHAMKTISVLLQKVLPTQTNFSRSIKITNLTSANMAQWPGYYAQYINNMLWLVLLSRCTCYGPILAMLQTTILTQAYLTLQVMTTTFCSFL